jgi:hypothetical protein
MVQTMVDVALMCVAEILHNLFIFFCLHSFSASKGFVVCQI